MLPKMLGAVTLFRPWGASTVRSPSGPVLVTDWAMNCSEKIDPPSPWRSTDLDHRVLGRLAVTPIMAVTAPRVAGKSVTRPWTPSLSLWRVNTMFFGSNVPPPASVSRKKATCWPGRAANGTRKVSVPWPLTDPAGTIVVPAPSRLLASVVVAWNRARLAPPRS